MSVLKFVKQNEARKTSYNRNNTNLLATNVQDAIDELYKLIDNYKTSTIDEINKNKQLSNLPTTGNNWREWSPVIFFNEGKTDSPVFEKIKQSPFHGYKFLIGSKCWSVFTVGLDYKFGGAVFVDVCWTSDGNSTGVVAWSVEYSVVRDCDKTTGGKTFSTPIIISQSGSGTALSHMKTSISSSIDITDILPHSIVMVNVTRCTPSSNSNPDNIYITSVNLRYQIN